MIAVEINVIAQSDWLIECFEQYFCNWISWKRRRERRENIKKIERACVIVQRLCSINVHFHNSLVWFIDRLSNDDGFPPVKFMFMFASFTKYETNIVADRVHEYYYARSMSVCVIGYWTMNDGKRNGRKICVKTIQFFVARSLTHSLPTHVSQSLIIIIVYLCSKLIHRIMRIRFPFIACSDQVPFTWFSRSFCRETYFGLLKSCCAKQIFHS